jgi:hypothetical protein
MFITFCIIFYLYSYYYAHKYSDPITAKIRGGSMYPKGASGF